MKKEYSKHEVNYIEKYQNEGYTTNFLFDKGCLVDSETKYAYQPDEIFIVAHHRYEGMSDPDDMSILYAINTKDQKRGTHLIGYGPMADLEEAEFFKDIPEENYSKNADIDELT
ncbi:hypothetical protein SGQ44_17360 [Flavobacterium sp. Fl-77]|uniref:Phosphoribosylpyrophosphate synthetase n=1 Tax=Flavobacterium flavipigmentatum TaxID=2893884 RepID=A0AAJ2VZP0_9FLAO|nr:MULTISPECIES: hypothetical protein [unclassified Flavobacterium]MDX6183905.1 hypothetical protein [Flavobacterium sp. Fl-33]MDX6187529.1 hypothetical protein [Flavobacterium sp. Fl-77]UFH37633.1 hypothetical protein LNP22_12885 [Flavobacterium sp. F-70]